MQSLLVNDPEGTVVYTKVTKDVTQVLIQFLAVKGHGKSSSLRTIIDQCIRNNRNLEFKIFDPSLAWFGNAPVKHRQLVTREKLRGGGIDNLTSCVYEIGSLTEEERRVFVGMVVASDYDARYKLKLEYPEALEHLPWIIYVFEEADTYFSSKSLNKNDYIGERLRDFVSIGRNFNMSAFLVATAEIGEVATRLRRRSNHIYGRIESPSDLSKIRRKSKLLMEQVKSLPRFHFIYDGGDYVSDVFRIPDTVNNVPMNVEYPVEEVKDGWWVTFAKWLVVTLIAGGLLALYYVS